LAKKLIYPAAKYHASRINAAALYALSVITGSGYIEGCTDHFNGLMLT
jgi:hypothetical protein